MSEQEHNRQANQQEGAGEEAWDSIEAEYFDEPSVMDDSEEELPPETYPEEEAPVEEELSGARYQVGNEGGSAGAFAAVGDHAQLVNINYIVQTTGEARRGRRDADLADLDDDFRGDLYQLIGKALASARRSELFPAPTSSETRASSRGGENAKALSCWNTTEIEVWYYGLQGYEQCYVQAVAVLHGAQASEISRRADGLYARFKMEQEHSEAPLPGTSRSSARTTQLSLPPTLHDRASADLYTRIHTVTRRVDGVERLFWSDIDEYGQSSFGLRFLDFLAGELLSKGVHGTAFLEHLERWSLDVRGEGQFFAARALGIVLWHQDVAALRQQASKWARSRGLAGWRRTAMLLNGAYDIDRLNQAGERKSATSCVLTLLQEWGDRGFSETGSSQTDMYVRCAAAYVYEVMGKHEPQIAMQGLEQLVLSLASEGKNARVLIASIISAYVSLSWSGHLSAVLTYLAQVAEQSLLQPVRPATFRQRFAHQQQCEVKLDVSLHAFVVLAASFLVEGSPIDPLVYEQPCPDPPIFPDPSGRDLILAGLIEPGASCWFDQILVLVAAAIMEKQRKYRLPAFDIIGKWAHYFPQQAESEEEREPLRVLRQFLLMLDSTLAQWDHDLQKRGKVRSPARYVYRKQLLRWAKQKCPISALARDVLARLHAQAQRKSERATR